MSGFIKKCLMGMLTIMLMLTGVCVLSTEGNKVQASETETYTTVEYTHDAIKTYKSNSEKPMKTDGDWIFAGWFTNPSCVTTYNVDSHSANGFAKFVPADVLSVKCQVTANTDAQDKDTDLRIVSTVDNLKYKQVGFDIYIGDKYYSYVSKNVAPIIEAKADGVEYGYSPNIFDLESSHFITVTITDIPQAAFDDEIRIKPYWITKDGTQVFGVSRYLKISDSYNYIINVPVRYYAGVGKAAGAVSIKCPTGLSYSEMIVGDAFAEIATTNDNGALTIKPSGKSLIQDGVYGYLRFKLANGVTLDNLQTTNIFEVTKGNETSTIVYKNYLTKYNGNNADVSWYNDDANEFVITSQTELYGLSQLGKTKKFENKTIYLGGDIEANRGYADKTNLVWNSNLAADGTTAITGTTYPWTAIGGANSGELCFNGTFDGQMHTISGLYMVTSESYRGLFGATDPKAKIRNFYLKNSYFESTGGNQYGSIVGNAKGTIENIYSEAIMLGNVGDQIGGLIGSTSTQGSVSMSNCWFAGSVTSQKAASYFGGLIGHVVNSTTITNCLNTGKVTVNANPSTEAAGGIIGGIESGSATIRNCVNTSEITTQDSAALRGLLVGYHKGGTITIENSHAYNQSNMTFVYNKDNNTYSDCGRYSVANVAGLNVLNQPKIGKLFTAETAKGYWSITPDSFPVLTAFEKGSGVISQSVDTSWYEESKDEYVLKDSGDLYGLALLSQTNAFTDKVIKLGADIIINEGKADDWSSTNAPDFSWMSIGGTNAITNTTTPRFDGVFDGQMHTISGIYLNATAKYQGLFAGTSSDAEIRNLYLKNSYFTSTDDGLGSVVGNGIGTFEKIYSNAIVEGNGGCDYVGGMIGTTSSGGGVTMTDCWFAGSAVINGQASYVGGLVGVAQYNSTIINCLNTGEVAHKWTGSLSNAGTGGFVGWVTSGKALSISYSVNYSKPTHEAGSYDGLFVAKLEGTVSLTESHSINHSGMYLVNKDNNSYSTCTRQNAADVAGLKALTTNKVKNLFLSDTAKGHWSITKDSLPVLTIFEKGSSVISQAVDTNWYDESKNEFTLMDSGDLYGLALLSQTNAFTDKVIKLGADIIVNEGKADDWSSTAPNFGWLCIGGTNDVTSTTTPRFNGVFDGQMHTISGIYLNASANYQGLFSGTSTKAEIRNFYLKNSYFKATSTDNNRGQLGSIVGNALGTFEKIYSDAIVAGHCYRVGGLFGGTSSSGGFTASDCWFAGSATINSAASYLGGIVGHVSYSSTIKNCLNTGIVDHKYNVGTAGIGGFVGYASANVSISDSVNYSNPTRVAGKYFGLLVGRPGGTITLTNSHSVSHRKHLVGSENGTDDTSSQYTTCSRQSISAVAGNKSLTTAKVKELFLADSAKGHWSITKDSLPVLTNFEKGSGVISQAVDTSWYDATKDTFELKDAADLYGLATLSYLNDLNGFAGKTIILSSDITLNNDMTAPDFEWLCIGGIGSPTPPFAGTFDGQMHTIKGLYVNSTSDYVGMFSGTTSSAKIQNLQLLDSKVITTGSYAGSIAGYAVGEFKNIYSKATVENGKRYIGGLIGVISDGNSLLEKCWFDGTVRSTNVGGTANNIGAGGLIGAVNNSTTGDLTLLYCLNSGTVDVSAYVNHVAVVAGGLIGWIQNHTDVTIDGCLVSGAMIGNDKITHSFGPIAGSVTLEDSDGVIQSSLSISRTYAVNDIPHKDSTRVEDDSFVYVAKNEIIGEAAKDKMPLLFNSSDWKCVDEQSPILDFANTVVKESLTATNDDKTQLASLYAGRQLYQGEMHNHAYTYGRGQGDTPGDDGTVTLSEWKEQMLTYGLDFASSLDHNQSDHIKLEDWKTSKFVYGSELGATITDATGENTIGKIHIDLIFKTQEQFDSFIQKYPQHFELSNAFFYGGTFTKTQFKTFIKDIIQAGGFFNLPHPLQNDEYPSKELEDYYFEVLNESQKQLIYGMNVITYDVNNKDATTANYAFWVQMLAKGYKVYATAGSDNHGNLTPYTLTSIYAATCGNTKCDGSCSNVECTGYDKGNMIPTLQQGDFVAGSAGIKMSVGTTTMGGTCDFTNQRVVVDVEMIHTIANDLNDKYRIDVINEDGVVYSKKLTLDSNGVEEGIELAFNADADSEFYRVVVYNATRRTRIAIGNPIWNASK